MYFSSHLRTKVANKSNEQKKQTDTHWRAKEGRGNFNYRMLFNFEVDPRLPVRRPCTLTLKCWNKEPLRLTSNLLGYKEVDISSMLTEALTERRHFLKRSQLTEETFQVGNSVELEKLLDRFKNQNRERNTLREEREKDSSRERYRKSKSIVPLEGSSSSSGQSGSKGCCGGTKDLGSVLDDMTEVQEIDILQASQEYKDHNLRRFELTTNKASNRRQQNGGSPGLANIPNNGAAADAEMEGEKPVVWVTIEVLHKSLVASRPAGEGRDEPNENPVLEQPEREKIGFGNLMGSLSMLVGPKLAKKAKILLLMALVLAMLVEIIPSVGSEFIVTVSVACL